MPYLVLTLLFFLTLILQISTGSGFLTLVKRFKYSTSFYFCFLAFLNIRTLLFTNLRTRSLTDYITNSASIYYRSQVTSSVTSSPAAAVVRSLIPTAWVGSKASPSPTTRLQSVLNYKIRINERRIAEAKHQIININNQISRSLYSLIDISFLMQYYKSSTKLSHVLTGIQKYVLVTPNNLQTCTYTYWLEIIIDVVVIKSVGFMGVPISLPPWPSIGILTPTRGCYKCSRFCRILVEIGVVSNCSFRLRRQPSLKRKRGMFYCYLRYSILKIDLLMIDLVGSWDHCGLFGARGLDGNSTGHYG